MTVMTNVVLVLKDSEGNIGIVKPLTDNDIIKIANAITDVGQVVDPATHMPIEATTASVGVVQLATAQDIKDGTANKVVDAKELINFAQTLPAVNGITDVSSGDNSNQLVVSRIGGSKTLTIDNVEHATQADTAASANSVAWDKVSGKPSSYTPSSHTHDDRYYTESEIDTKLSGKSDTTHNHNSAYLGITAKAESAKSADSVAWGNVSGKPSTFTPSSHTHTKSQITDFPTIPTNTNQLTNGAGFITSSGSCNYANSAGSAGRAEYLGDLGSTDRNGDSGTGWYSVGFSHNYDEGHNELAINNYWGIRLNCRDSDHVTINGNRIIDSGNIGSQSVNYAKSAGSVAWGNVSGRPDIWIG